MIAGKVDPFAAAEDIGQFENGAHRLDDSGFRPFSADPQSSSLPVWSTLEPMSVVRVPPDGELMNSERLHAWITSYSSDMPFTPFDYPEQRPEGYPYDLGKVSDEDIATKAAPDSYRVPSRFHVPDYESIAFDYLDPEYIAWYERVKPALESEDVWVWHDGRGVYYGQVVGVTPDWLLDSD